MVEFCVQLATDVRRVNPVVVEAVAVEQSD
jgi:hypothetical protein